METTQETTAMEDQLREGFVVHGISEHMHGGFVRYVNYGIKPGSFMTALLCNDLEGTLALADDVNQYQIPSLVAFMRNYLPGLSRGGRSEVERWIEKGGWINIGKTDIK